MNKNELTKIIKESIINYFYESLNTQKQKYGDDLVNKLLPLDPSKTYKYIEQICNYYNQNIPEDEIKKYIDLYDTKLTKNLISKEYSNINNIKTFNQLKDIVDNKSQETSHTEAKTNLMKETYIDTVKTNKGSFEVYRPYNTLQQIQLGKNTKWCISQIKDRNYFNKYFITDDVRFYIFVKDNDTKYQLNIYPDNRKQVWNTLDKNIGCKNFKELTDINCDIYNWHPINKYTKDIIVYDKFENKLGHIINNKREGDWKEYWENGNIDIKAYYKNGKLDGEYLVYHKNGIIFMRSNYKDGKLNGENITYDNNGNLWVKCYYKDDALNGEDIEYRDNGNIKAKDNYANGKLNGDYIKYYKDGSIEEKGYYKNDKLDGEWIRYYEDGNIEEKCYYKDGDIEGECEEYL